MDNLFFIESADVSSSTTLANIFLATVRAAMRGLDDAIDVIGKTSLRGNIRISADGHSRKLFVQPLVLALQRAHPELTPHLTHVSNKVASERLRDGTLDVVLMANPDPHPELTIEKVADLDFGLFASKAHPLTTNSSPTTKDALAYPFATLSDASRNHFPVDLKRKVGAVVDDYSDLLDLCHSGLFLAMLPTLLVKNDSLIRLVPTIQTSQSIYLVFVNHSNRTPRLRLWLKKSNEPWVV